MHLERINRLCEEFKFDNEEYFGGDVKIKTTNDNWLIRFKDNGEIDLFHSNKFERTGYHYQKDFTGLRYVFEYIRDHENKHMNRFNKMFRIKSILATL